MKKTLLILILIIGFSTTSFANKKTEPKYTNITIVMNDEKPK